MPGGGGYGPPEHRDRALVRRDVEEGFVSEEAARAVYELEGD
jgi:N-methylhydantoinase B/oxoprolinase/acetone carboxylase alpha subunit